MKVPPNALHNMTNLKNLNPRFSSQSKENETRVSS